MIVTAHSLPASIRSGVTLLLGGWLLTGIGLAVARTSDHDQPIHYVAKYTKARNAPNTVSTLNGQVRITQGSLMLKGDVARIHLDAHMQVARIVITGHPAHIQQQDNHHHLMRGRAKTLDYDNIHGIAVMTGQASITRQGYGHFHGYRLTYNTTTGTFTGRAKGNSLIHGVFLSTTHPRAKTDNTNPNAPAVNTSPPHHQPSIPARIHPDLATVPPFHHS